MRILLRIWAAVIHNFGWRVLALLIAVAIWLIVASEPELSTFATVPLEFRNLPDDLEMSSPPSENVTLELRGPSAELRGLGDSRAPSVVVDMSGAGPGIRSFVIGGSNVRLARGVHLIRAIPNTVRFDFDRRLSRTVPVKVRFAGEGERGYLVGHYAVTPDKLVIVGPNRHVQRIGSAITDPLDVSAAVGTTEFRVNALVEDAFVRFQSSPEVTVTVSMKKK